MEKKPEKLPDHKNMQPGMPSKRPPAAVFIWLLVLVMIITLFIYKFTPSLANTQDLSQSEFELWLKQGWIKTAVILPGTDNVLDIEGEYEKKPAAAPEKTQTAATAQPPAPEKKTNVVDLSGDTQTEDTPPALAMTP